jgi:hypothetical protein
VCAKLKLTAHTHSRGVFSRESLVEINLGRHDLDSVIVSKT